MHVDIRQGTVADARSIAQVHMLGWQVGYRGLLPQPFLDGLDPEQRVPRWTEALAGSEWPRRGTLVAHDGAAMVGFTWLGPSRDDDAGGTAGEVFVFHVLPADWGRGVGRVLMAAAVEALTSAGYRDATLWVLDANARAIGFYEHLGWQPDGTDTIREIAGQQVRLVRYRRALPR